jgi:hypothetical protein
VGLVTFPQYLKKMCGKNSCFFDKIFPLSDLAQIAHFSFMSKAAHVVSAL